MTKQMLAGIRVETKKELEDRIYKYFDEINAQPSALHLQVIGTTISRLR